MWPGCIGLVQICRKEADVTEAMWSKAVTRLRSILGLWLCKDSEKPLGGPGEVACLDKTFICKKKRAKGANYFGNDRAGPGNSEGNWKDFFIHR